MKKKKKPDNVVWDENKEEYIARLLPYGSDTSSPVIDVPNVAGFKKEGVDKASKQFNAELEDLKSKIKTLHNNLYKPQLFFGYCCFCSI